MSESKSKPALLISTMDELSDIIKDLDDISALNISLDDGRACLRGHKSDSYILGEYFQSPTIINELMIISLTHVMDEVKYAIETM